MAPAQKKCFTGTFENTGNGILTDYLALQVDEGKGSVIGTFKDGTGVVTNLEGELKGDVLYLKNAATGEDFDEARMYDNNTVKFSSFTKPSVLKKLFLKKVDSSTMNLTLLSMYSS